MRRENCALRLAAVALKSALALAASTAAGLALPQAGPATTPTSAQDPLAGALQERITGKKSPDDVRIDVDWLRGTKPVTARIYGDGVGIWDRSSQFTLTRDQVVAALKVFRDARFGAMPASFGSDMEGEDESPVRLKGQVVLRIGPQVKRVAQMGDGDQSTGLAGIAEKLLAICAGPAARGKGARSLAEGIRLLEEKTLSPQVLSVAVQRGEGSGERWILRVDGRTVTDRVDSAGRYGLGPAPPDLVGGRFSRLRENPERSAGRGAAFEPLRSRLYGPSRQPPRSLAKPDRARIPQHEAGDARCEAAVLRPDLRHARDPSREGGKEWLALPGSRRRFGGRQGTRGGKKARAGRRAEGARGRARAERAADARSHSA